MEKDKLEEFLNKKTVSPAPFLTADPFLPTRIESLLAEKKRPGKYMFKRWSMAIAIATCAIVMGIYIGNDLSVITTNQTGDDLVAEYAQAVYQADFVDDLTNALENGESK
jgi:hypothetical protein